MNLNYKFWERRPLPEPTRGQMSRTSGLNFSFNLQEFADTSGPSLTVALAYIDSLDGKLVVTRSTLAGNVFTARIDCATTAEVGDEALFMLYASLSDGQHDKRPFSLSILP